MLTERTSHPLMSDQDVDLPLPDAQERQRSTPGRTNHDHRPLRVAALIDLPRHPKAGGHVKAWERFADAAKSFGSDLDLTVYFLGDGETEERLSDNVRIRTVPPAFGTARIPWLRNGGGDTDLASYNPHLAKYLTEHDVIHVTSAFGFAKTAQTVSRQHGLPLVSSIHTDAAKFAEVYTSEIIKKMVGSGLLSRLLIDQVGVPEISARNLTRQRDRILRASDHILVSNPQDQQDVTSAMPYAHVSFLRRGIDKSLFSPARRDRVWLEEAYGVPADVPVMLFAGRVDQSKRVLTTANAARLLIEQGHRLHLVIAGEGAEKATIEAMLGSNVTMTGNVAQDDLARLMASADLFIFPSESETVGNVVIEAKASGLPVVVTAGATTAQLIASPGTDGLLSKDGSAEAYADVIAPLLVDREQRRRMGLCARHHVEASLPDWPDVIAEDLMPVWREALDQAASPGLR